MAEQRIIWSPDLAQLWADMYARSWEPSQWFHPLEEGDSPVGQRGYREERLMWVYLQVKDNSGHWEVGFYSPDKEWHAESSHPSKELAAERVHWLNGGNKQSQSR